MNFTVNKIIVLKVLNLDSLKKKQIVGIYTGYDKNVRKQFRNITHPLKLD